MLQHYQITLQEQLTVESDGSWLDGLSITRVAGGGTILTGSFPDQAALVGLLVRLHSLNLTLLDVSRVHSPVDEDGTPVCV